MKQLSIQQKLVLLAVLSVVFLTAPALAGTIIPDDVSSSNPYFVTVANDAGASADLYGNDTYAMVYHGGGFGMTFETDNLYDSTDTTGENLFSNSSNGSFYLNFYGGRGGVQRVVLMLAVNGTIPDDFRAHFRTSGYKLNYSETLAERLNALTPDDIAYEDPGIDEVFAKSDFIYGPQVTRPPGTAAIYHEQNTSNTDDTFQILFVDTGLGIVGNRAGAHGTVDNTDLTNTGKLKVEYSFENLGDCMAVIDAYGWLYSGSNSTTDLDPGISWTNLDSTDGEVRVLLENESVPDAPVANFSAVPTYGEAPLTVQFTDLSTGSPTAWSWDFGDGNTSTEQNPAHTYGAVGTYTVNLTVANAGGSDTATATDSVTVTMAGGSLLADSAWPKFGYDLGKTGQSPYDGPQTPTLKWNADIGKIGKAGPAIGSDGTIYIGTSEGSMYALNPDGLIKWNVSAGGSIDSTPALCADGTIYFGSSNGYFYALNSDGNEKWNYSVGETDTVCSPVIGLDGTVYFTKQSGDYDRYIYALNSDGTEKWKYDLYSYTGRSTITYCSPVISSDGTIYVSYYNRVFAFDSDGNLKGTPAQIRGMYNSPVIGPDGTVYVSTQSKNYIAALTQTDEGLVEKWRYIPVATFYRYEYSSPVVASDGTVYASTDGNIIVATTPGETTGTVKWICSDLNSYTVSTPVIGADGTIYIGSSIPGVSGSSSGSGDVFAINPADGTIKWKYDLPEVYSSPAIGSDGTLYIGTSNGLYAFENVVDFTADTQDVEAGKTPVQFAGTSGRTVSNWHWDFGDGTTSDEQNPSHLYGSAGTFTVNLTVTEEGTGETFTASKPAYVTVLGRPVADFNASAATGQAPLEVTFTDLSTGLPTSWLWDFGDGANATEQNPTHTYNVSGLYTVTLTAANDAGTNTTVKTGYVNVTPQDPPVASFTANVTSGRVPLSVAFTDTSTGYNITGWFWDFGDGSNSTEQNPVHTYAAGGNFTVSLTATNDGGSNVTTAADLMTVIENRPPITSFSANRTQGKFPLTVQFTDASLGLPTSWLWDFGDGSNSTEQNPQHIYTAVGTYNVSLTAANADGSTTATKDGYIVVKDTNAVPLSSYRFINVYVANDDGVKYDVPDGAAASGGMYEYVNNTYWVMFRQSGGGLNPLHISASDSTNTAKDITTTTNQSGSFWVTFSGGQPTMPDAILLLAVNGTIPDDFKVHIRSSGNDFDVGTPGTTNQMLPTESTHLDGAVNETFDKDDFIYGPQTWKPCSSEGYPLFGGEDQTDPANQYQLMFIDLKVGALQNTSLPDNGMIKIEYDFSNLTSTAVFNVYGWFMQCNHGTGIIMTNNVATSGYTVTQPIPAVAPVASFTANVTSGETPLAVQFTDTSSNTPTSWAWDFDNDSVVDSTEQNPTHVYIATGTYTVNLTVTNAAGTDSEVKTGYIYVTSGGSGGDAPVASFSAAPTSGAIPLTVQFTDLSTGSPTSWSWNFGDGSTSTEQNPTHTYTTTGTYTVNLTVANAAGSDSEVKADFITVSDGGTPAATGLANSAWPKLGGADLNNTGRSPYVGAQTNATKWVYTTGGQFLSAVPAIGPNGTIYIGNYDKNVYALNPNGTLKWTYTAENSFSSPPAIGADGTIYLGNYLDYKVYALNSDGTLKWTYNTTAMIDGGPTIGPDGTIYIGNNNGTLYALNPDGTKKWSYPCGGSIFGIPAIGSDGTIYSGAGEILFALNPDGTLKWSYTLGGAGATIYGSPLIGQDGSIYVGSNDKNLYALNPDGTLNWAYTTGGAIRNSPVMGTDGTIYFGNDGDKKVYALNPDGTLKWTYLTGRGIRYASPAVGADGTIYIGSEDKNFYALNPDGTLKWFYETGGKIRASPSIAPDGTVYIASRDGNVYAFDGVVNITADTGVGPSPLTVNFQGTSPLTVTAWNWDFGDGTTSTEQNPSHTYVSAGTYAVNLTITHASGTNYLVQTVTVAAPAVSPVANFTTDVTGGNAPLSVQFTDLSANAPTSWSWDFGDGSTSTEQNPTHTYTTIGTYTVNLTAANAVGSDTLVKTDCITVRGISSIAVAPVSAALTRGDTQQFVATAYDADSNTVPGVSFTWTCSDDTVGTVNATGDFTALAAGTTTVSAAAGNVTGTATVTVTPPHGDRTEDSSLNVPGFTITDAGNGTRQVLVNTTAVNTTVSGSTILIDEDTFSLTIETSGSPTVGNGTVNGTVAGITLNTTPITTIFDDLGTVTASLEANLTGIPAGAAVQTTVSANVSADAMSAFQLAASNDGLSLDAVAYTMNIVRTNLTNGQDISDATIRMAVSQTWVAAYGGTDAIVIIRSAEDGTEEVLETTYVGFDADGNLVFEAYSPNGLSIFGLAAATAQSTPSSSSGSSGGGQSTLSAASAGSVGAGETVTLTFDETAVTAVDVQAKDAIQKILLTAEAGAIPDGAGAPDGAVYQYVSIEDYTDIADSMERATVRFGVSADWVDAHASSPDSIALYRYDDATGEWTMLSTVYVGEESGRYTYYADTAAFGYFAIVTAPGTTAVTTAPTEPVGETTTAGQTTEQTTAVPTTTAQPTPLFGGGTLLCALFAVAAVLAAMNRRRR